MAEKIIVQKPEPEPVKVRFLETYTVQDGSGDTYEKGKVYELSPDSADHFVSRRRAERLEGRTGPSPVGGSEPKRAEPEAASRSTGGEEEESDSGPEAAARKNAKKR